MRSYLEIIKELSKTINSDVSIPAKDRAKINGYVNKLLDLLWKYSA